MRMSGRTIWSALVLLAGLAGSAAGEASSASVPESAFYAVTATLVPGPAGAELCGTDRGDGHIDFRIGFGSDMRLCVNGVDAGPYDPAACYLVTVECHNVFGQWFATTHITNLSTGGLVFAQIGLATTGGAEEVVAAAQDVSHLSVQ